MKLIEIIKNNYGFTNKEAKEYIKNIDEKTKKKILEGFEKNACKSFYED